MTQHETANKSPRSAFLSALYEGSDQNLFMELRCIHPQTGEVKLLWSRIGDKGTLTRIFRQADNHNREGFGVYFAPALRHEKKGSAASTASVSALWVDVDSYELQALEQLSIFDPAPSFLIESGGGWHGYWLLEQPFVLKDETDRQRIGRILKGLSDAVGGDPNYAKSVASVMRLPGSLNTKPERGNVVQVMECHPERHYPLEVFAWLETSPEGKAVSPMPMGAYAALPSRTETYLSNGASKGQRNAELFAAACQLRDAGHNQSEAEQVLVARYVADGNTEREALATVASAYSRPAREPILSPHEQIAQLVQRQQQSELERPNLEQITGAVTACAHLNAVEWAAERQKLTTVCGDGLKVSDLDRLYRDAKRKLERDTTPTMEQSDQYLCANGSMVYERQTERGTTRQVVANWIGKVVERSSRMDDDGQTEHLATVELQHGEETQTLHISTDHFGDPNAFQRFIAGRAGEPYTVRAGMTKHLIPAILSLSGEYPKRTSYRFMGWTQIEGGWTYVSPEMSIRADGKLESSSDVGIEHRLRDYSLSESAEGMSAFEAAVATLPKHLAPTLIAFTLLPVLQRFFPPVAPKPALHLVGTSGSGKSEIAALMASFYGHFTRDTPPAQWGDTVNTVETLGYALADTLYWVDDYKAIYADEKTFTRFLQSYSRSMGRGRLSRDAKVKTDRYCRGLLLSTGETTIEGEASVLSRMLVLEVPPWEKRDPNGTALATFEGYRAALPSFTAQFIQWIACQIDRGSLQKELSERFAHNAKGYSEKLRANLPKQAHTGRMIQNWAVLVTTYQMLRQFMVELDCDDVLPGWQDSIVETVKAVQQERAGQVFIDTLGQLLASGELMLAKDMQQPEEPRPGTTIVGYLADRYVYLLPDVAHRAVLRVQPLKFNTSAIGAQLKEDGWLIPGTNNLTVQRRIRGISTRLWQLKADFLGCDDCDAVTVTE